MMIFQAAGAGNEALRIDEGGGGGGVREAGLMRSGCVRMGKVRVARVTMFGL